MKHRVALLVLTAFLFGLPATARAAEPEGPRLAISASAGEESALITVGPTGEQVSVLVARPDFWGIGDRLSWSADGSSVAFFASGPFQSDPGGAYGTGWPLAAVARTDGGGSRVFSRAFLNAGEPVMAPDGRTVVFSRMKLVKVLPGRESYLFKVAIWSLAVERGAVRRLTRWRVGAFVDPISFSPDGSSVVAELSDRRGDRLVAIDLDGSGSRRLARLAPDVQEPTYSPDGTKLAFVRDRTRRFQLPKPDRPVHELWVADADGSGARRLLRRTGYISFPSWDPSGSRLAFTRDPLTEASPELEPEPGNQAMAINADGTCLVEVYSNPEVIVGGVAWQPGPGREAGPISC